jgi:tetratricopeptide (TPR) repeat protein
MRHRKTFFTVSFCLISLLTLGQDFQKKFKDLLAKDDTVEQRKLLANWETTNSKDPELFIAYFNYYARKSMTELVSLGDDKKDDQSLLITDSTGKSVGYIGSSVRYNPVILQKGFDYIDKGISLYPSRLDMRFGKIYMLGQAENFSEYTHTVVETIDYANKIQNAWLWSNGEPLDSPKEFLLNSMQSYIMTIYDTEDDSLLPYMREISETVLKYYPNDVESLDNVALTYLIVEDYDKALSYLLRAETIAPQDAIVLNNIAEAYKRKHDGINAKKYYEKVIKYGNEEEVERAKEELKKL